MEKMIDIILVNPNVTLFADMLNLQRNVDFKQIRIIAVYGHPYTDASFMDSGICDVKSIYVPNLRNIEQAYNEGIEFSLMDNKVSWLMFCDGRDCFSSVYSLWTILHVLPVNTADILWAEGYHEDAITKNTLHINRTSEDFAHVAGKLYNASFLKKYNLLFSDDCGEMSEYAFNTVAIACSLPHRILKIKSQVSPYLQTFRLTGTTSASVCEYMVMAAVTAAYVILDKGKPADTQIVKAIYYAYIAQATKPYFKLDIRTFHKLFTNSFRNAWHNMSGNEREVVFGEAYDDFLNAFQTLFNNFGKGYIPPEDSVKMADNWYEHQINTYNPFHKHNTEPSDIPSRSRRVAVYSGTRNVYKDIITSMKSLLFHTRMDAVYVLAEDDSIADDLPDCVKVINVSNQSFFPSSGPNYDTPWSYMILLRAAYPDLFPDEDVVLSLDIDTIVQEDISDLFDINLSDYYFAGVHEVTREESNDYCNFGVILMNLKKLRDGKASEIIESLNVNKWYCPEQTAFNTLCHGHILTIPNRFNATPYSRLTGEPERESITHYAGIRYWACFSNVIYYNNMSWKDVLDKGVYNNGKQK